MKRKSGLLIFTAILCMLFAFSTTITYAAEQTVPYKNEFNTNGVLTTGTDGFSYSSGQLSVVDGVLRMTTAGTDTVKTTGADDNTGIHLNLDFGTVTAGTLVFETDFYPPTAGGSFSKGFLNLYDSTGKKVVQLSKSSDGKNTWWVNDDTTKLNNATSSGAPCWGIKIEIDLERDVYRVYQAKTKTDGEWNYNLMEKTNSSGQKETEFPFTDSSATNVSSMSWTFRGREIHTSSSNGVGIDNIKVYKKFTTTPAQSTYDMLEGETMQAQLNITPSSESLSNLIWESNDTSIATIDSNGIITAKSKGSTTVTVKHNFYTSVNHTFTVNVVNGATGIAIDKAESTIVLGDSVRLSLSPIPENTTYRNVVWSSSDDSIATVDNGVVTATGKGTATITVTATGKDGATLTASSVVNVLKPLTGLSISAPKTSFEVGESATFSAVVIPADASNVVKTWRSGNHYVATVDQNGKVTAVGNGSTEIYVSSSGFAASQPIIVGNAEASASNKKPSLISFYTPSGFSFYDIADMEWAQSSVYSAVESGCISPDSDTIFGAKRNIKRDEFVSVVIKTFGLSGEIENPEALKNFTDVSEDNAYYSEIMKALDLGIIQGVSDTEFAPDADITRQDMSVVIVNAMKVAGVKTEEGRLDFADKDSIAEYAQTAVRILSKMEIIKGKSANMFDPLANTTRAEVAVIVDRINANR